MTATIIPFPGAWHSSLDSERCRARRTVALCDGTDMQSLSPLQERMAKVLAKIAFREKGKQR